MHHPFQGLERILRREEPLARHTTFRIGGPAEFFLEPRDLDDLREVAARIVRAGVAWRVLGRGSNVLAPDAGVRGAVVSLRRYGPRRIRRDGVEVHACAGAGLCAAVRAAARWSLSGLEALAGIPGTVGGAVWMNAGPAQGCVSDRIAALDVLEQDGTLARVARGELRFGYRDSGLPRGVVVAGVVWRLTPAPRHEVEEKCRTALERKKATQPLSRASAGCVFKNPRAGAAGALIERAGLKGERCRGAMVSRKHANFIVNCGGASAADVRRLMDRVRETVRARTGTTLEAEVHVWE